VKGLLFGNVILGNFQKKSHGLVGQRGRGKYSPRLHASPLRGIPARKIVYNYNSRNAVAPSGITPFFSVDVGRIPAAKLRCGNRDGKNNPSGREYLGKGFRHADTQPGIVGSAGLA